MNRIAIAVTLPIAATAAQAVEDKAHDLTPPQGSCLETALRDYMTANTAVVAQIPRLIEATIAQRRLQEGYCLQVVRCKGWAPSSMDAAVTFSSCLDDEAREHLGK
jgi:hypothetical protein